MIEGVTNLATSLESANHYELSNAFEHLNKAWYPKREDRWRMLMDLNLLDGRFQQELRSPEFIFDADKLAVDIAILLTEDLDIYPKTLI